uniref:C-type lectin domain-containing protein n=1 Tax=Xiphophorus couchianus TaxID=32473 RepID=A0A3B5KXM6_9TELE
MNTLSRHICFHASFPLPAPDCGSNPGWRKNNNICYYYNDTDIVDFHTAIMRCYAEKAMLVSILNKNEQAYLAIIDNHYLKDLQLPSWIGLSDLLVENQYAWSDGVSPVLYTNWNEHEPNNAGGEHCVAMTHGTLTTGKWNDDACHRNHSFVCYRKKCKSDKGTFFVFF